ncbi:MAG: ATP-binding protein [Muribaculaceae bacterium]|nr:ATP-binding protein [Roseburia sp.]MCM1432150.1 ATP-binding protein [Muribaculaceae bacterium]MCM1493631.1 ATP-binding protein [Muribaculaceae bacterium]MCM1560184.1 ATP-binding protein [Butyrivibrio sp.]
MNNLIYLLNITVSGIKCIKGEVRFDFYKKTINREFDPEKYRIKAIYGENGSGKSAVVTAVKIFQDILLNNRYLNESKNQSFLDEIINKSAKTFRFSCEYLVTIGKERTAYRYTIELKKEPDGLYRIAHEELKLKSGNYANSNYKVIFESRYGELVFVDCGEENRERVKKLSMNLLSDNSLPGIYILNIDKLEDSGGGLLFHLALCLILAATIRVYLADEDQHELYFLRKVVREADENHTNLFKDIREEFEGSLTFLSVNEKIVPKKYYEEYREKVGRLTKFIKLFKQDLVSIEIEAKEDGENYRCDLNLDYGDYLVNKEFESTGIKKLIHLFDCFMAASDNGIVFIDEMDSNINDVYLCRLIEYFMFYGNGQLCFTTHNLDPMSILKENKNSIDFLSGDNRVVSWTARGNASPDNYYRNGMIEDSPFNIYATDFLEIFGK